MIILLMKVVEVTARQVVAVFNLGGGDILGSRGRLTIKNKLCF